MGELQDAFECIINTYNNRGRTLFIVYGDWSKRAALLKQVIDYNRSHLRRVDSVCIRRSIVDVLSYMPVYVLNARGFFNLNCQPDFYFRPELSFFGTLFTNNHPRLSVVVSTAKRPTNLRAILRNFNVNFFRRVKFISFNKNIHTPTLFTLCKQTIIRHKISVSPLPRALREIFD